MTAIDIKKKSKSIGISAVITRADGTVEDLGLISYRHKNPLISIPMRIWVYFRNLKRRIKP